MSIADKIRRSWDCNEAIRIIGSHGHRFFYSSEFDRFARFNIDDRGRVWFIDNYSGTPIYTHYNGRWRHFNNGGTLKALVIKMRDYITKGQKLSRGYIGPETSWTDGNVWGYSEEEMRIVREKAGDLPCFIGGGHG